LPEMKELSYNEMEELARDVLGSEYHMFLDALLQVAKESPLVVVVGGHLIARDEIPPGMLERHEDFQRAVLDKFKDSLLGTINKDKLSPRLCKDVLLLISVLSPIHPQDEVFRQKASEFLGVESYELVRAIGILEESGILLRRGYSLRITPDVLSDHILYDACITAQSESTGYAEKVFEVFGDTFFSDILFNISETEWHARKDSKDVDLLGETWTRIKEEFKDGSHFQRSQMLDLLERIAFFRPARVLELIEHALRKPSTAAGNEKWAKLYQWNHTEKYDMGLIKDGDRWVSPEVLEKEEKEKAEKLKRARARQKKKRKKRRKGI
ncbi:unnamed protein product, partial [marine sediment metagenome]